MSHFTDNHPIEMLQSTRKPSRKDALRALARRVAWLSNKIETFAGRSFDPRASYLVEELAAIAIAVEAIERARQPEVPTKPDQALIDLLRRSLNKLYGVCPGEDVLISDVEAVLQEDL